MRNAQKMSLAGDGVIAVLVTVLVLQALTLSDASAAPTCSGTLGIAVHGQHVVGDYVIGGGVDWPPSGVGEAIVGRGAHLPGGPGPTFHFANGFAPGASFCLSQSQSPGLHPGP